MGSRNDHTGQEMRTKPSTQAYDEGWDRIFGNKNKPEDRLNVLCKICGLDPNKKLECAFSACPRNFEET